MRSIADRSMQLPVIAGISTYKTWTYISTLGKSINRFFLWVLTFNKMKTLKVLNENQELKYQTFKIFNINFVLIALH